MDTDVLANSLLLNSVFSRGQGSILEVIVVMFWIPDLYPPRKEWTVSAFKGTQGCCWTVWVWKVSEEQNKVTLPGAAALVQIPTHSLSQNPPGDLLSITTKLLLSLLKKLQEERLLRELHLFHEELSNSILDFGFYWKWSESLKHFKYWQLHYLACRFIPRIQIPKEITCTSSYWSTRHPLTTITENMP